MLSMWRETERKWEKAGVRQVCNVMRNRAHKYRDCDLSNTILNKLSRGLLTNACDLFHLRNGSPRPRGAM